MALDLGFSLAFASVLTVFLNCKRSNGTFNFFYVNPLGFKSFVDVPPNLLLNSFISTKIQVLVKREVNLLSGYGMSTALCRVGHCALSCFVIEGRFNRCRWVTSYVRVLNVNVDLNAIIHVYLNDHKRRWCGFEFEGVELVEIFVAK